MNAVAKSATDGYTLVFSALLARARQHPGHLRCATSGNGKIKAD